MTAPVNFYILHTTNWQAKDHLACQLVEKAWQQGNSIYIHTNSLVAAQHIDILLWTYKEESFLPHNISSTGPICIGYTEEVPENMDVLINLSEVVPPCISKFKRIAEIVDDIEPAREAGRRRYKFYKQQGHELQKYNINR
ncbi:DNA polymerase III subunit chi [Candidatus Marithrix sp. Canyon 246]|uniref:DNA polymerase III subunit chi n=1 Tax=Candidatus Marithrix sp. Canyon 246 TaxID=1827136 RepID=UPI00084A03C0|nr:DNA polymerase III subunit chi [Candidatus Marithrix sp. Canyon 246]